MHLIKYFKIKYLILPRTWNTGFNNMSFIDVYKYLELALKIVNNNQVYDSELDFINKTLLIHDVVEKETMKSLTQILNVYTSTNGAVGNLDTYVEC